MTRIYSNDMQIEQVCRSLVKDGWRAVSHHKHVKMRSPDGSTVVVVPSTPSDWRSVLNWLSQLRRKGVDLANKKARQGMNYNMRTPCDACPFLKGSGFSYRSLQEHAAGEFACHKTCELSDESVYEPKDKSLHCAGALIFLEKQGTSHQMMRICERIGLYDRTKLDMTAAVVAGPEDCQPRGANR